MTKHQKQIYLCVGIYTIDEVLPYVVFHSTIQALIKRGVKRGSREWFDATHRTYEGINTNMTSNRYRVFATKGLTCVNCGIKGEFFSLERHKASIHDKYHFNLYARKNEKDILMTKDHIIPKSKGGKNCLNNYQPMCAECNFRKADKVKA